MYIGVTNNLAKRVDQHKIKINSDSFTGKYRLYKLVWFEEFKTSKEAIAIEKKIKKWRRDKKNWLIEKENPKWKDLYTLR